MIWAMTGEKNGKTMPVWLAVGIALVLLGVLVGDGLVRLVLMLSGVLALAYGVGQYLRENRRT
jgi:uncharacterized membrane protein YidH (DUF202 family)